MDASVGDRIVVESERAAQSGRAGVIEEVLADDPPRFLDFCRARPPEEAKAKCARLVGRSCEFGTDASLEGGAVVIKTGGVALAFG